MSDNELDNLFKEAADGFKASKDSSAWDAMSKKLDNAGVGTSGFWNWKTISTVSVVGITGIASILYFAKTEIKSMDAIAVAPNSLNQSKQTKPVDAEVAEPKPSETATSESSKNSKLNESEKHISSAKHDVKKATAVGSNGKNSEKQIDPLAVKTNRDRNKAGKDFVKPTNNEPITTPSQSSHLLETKQSGSVSTSPDPVVSKKSVTPNEALKPAVGLATVVQRDNTTLAKDEKSEKLYQKKEITENVAALDKGKGNQSSEKSGNVLTKSDDSSVAGVKKEPGSEMKDISVEKDSIKSVGEDVVEEKKDKDPTSVVNEDPSKEQITQKGIVLKLAMAPDYSSVKRSSPNSLGYSYGLLVQYKFNEHWSIATGGIWEKKIYSAQDVEYNGYTADRVDGDCRMWDIPVNVYYSFFPANKFSFYAGLGFSSYIMNKENYVMHYEGPYGTYDYPVEVKGENNEWFKTLNVSLGMQMRVNRVLSFQFEPTLKAPLAGVGAGEVSLLSFGAFLNARFDIPIR